MEEFVEQNKGWNEDTNLKEFTHIQKRLSIVENTYFSIPVLKIVRMIEISISAKESYKKTILLQMPQRLLRGPLMA